MEELIALIISLRPNGIEPEAIPEFVRLVHAACLLELTKDKP